MQRFTVEFVRDGKAVKRVAILAENVVEAAKIWGPVTIPPGDEPDMGEWIRVTHPDDSTAAWFELDR